MPILPNIHGIDPIKDHNNGQKTYYFKLNKNTNEFRVHNRIVLLNHNISDDTNFNYDYKNKKNIVQHLELSAHKEVEVKNDIICYDVCSFFCLLVCCRMKMCIFWIQSGTSIIQQLLKANYRNF